MKNLLLLFSLLIIVSGCKENENTVADSGDNTATITDAQLFQLVKSSPKAAYFNNVTDTIPGNSGAAHAGNIFVWYNVQAKSQLTLTGRVQTNPVFPDSSLIVKEIFNSTGTKLYYAIMFKFSRASNKGPGDWVWAELNADGSPFISAAGKGESCAGCHSPGFDYTRMNDTHP
ncbi:MAG: hypothetical protein WCW35_07665 [Bacteroidota bacterium]|jgi:hypothetical protein